MANNNSSNNQINVPEAREAMYNMKHEVANELGVTLNNGYNGNLSSKDAGRIGGNMVRKMIEAAEAEGTEVDIVAYPVGEMDQHLDGVDCALLGPQVGYMKAQMQKTAAAKGVPCDVIPMADYGMVNGKNVLAFAKKLIEANK